MKSSIGFFGLLFCHLAYSARVPVKLKDSHDVRNNDSSDGSDNRMLRMAGFLGIDVSSLVTEQQFELLVGYNFKYLIVRAFRSIGW